MPADLTADTIAADTKSGFISVAGRTRALSLPRLGLAKLAVDKIGALAGLMVLSPLMLAIAAWISLTEGGPVTFSHRRVGKGGRAFDCFKFRTMVPEAAEILKEVLASDPIAREEWEQNFKFERDPRVTRLGAFLRKSSLDELPQLWNVLRGDMSLVGPRPVTDAEGALYGEHFATYKSVRPGLTGLWQISGRSNTTYDERVALDVSYVRQAGVLTDLKILVLTVVRVLQGRGAV